MRRLPVELWGAYHACARRQSGQVVCWGYNDNGQLGDGSITNAVEISAGHWHTCARRPSGNVVCWGANSSGQLGDGSITDAVEISAGVEHTCARRQSGQVVCWGANGAGQLGDGSITDAVEISAGYWHTCARRQSGQVVCWGSNGAGQLGDGSITDAVEISAGHGHTCAWRQSGQVVCWGSNSSGQLGDGSITDAVEISAGDYHTCARRQSGQVVCWGYNASICDPCITQCSLQNGVGECVDGVCSVSRCQPGYADCDGDATNGCEADLQNDPNNCGGCNTECTADSSMSLPFCRAGSCTTETATCSFVFCFNSEFQHYPPCQLGSTCKAFVNPVNPVLVDCTVTRPGRT